MNEMNEKVMVCVVVQVVVTCVRTASTRAPSPASWRSTSARTPTNVPIRASRADSPSRPRAISTNTANRAPTSSRSSHTMITIYYYH